MRIPRAGAAAVVLGLSLVVAPPAAADTGAADASAGKASADRASERARRTARADTAASRTSARPAAGAPGAGASNPSTSDKPPTGAVSPRRERGESARPDRPATVAHRTLQPPSAKRIDLAPLPPAVMPTRDTLSGNGIEPAPEAVPAETPAMAVAGATARATTADSVADLFTGLFTPIRSFFEGIGLLIRRTFFNQAPTVNPVQLTGQTAGLVTGTLNAVDPEGDPLSFDITEFPQYGSVSIGADGGYVYTPGPDFDGRDAFNVAVSDGGPHLNLLDPGRPPATEAYVQVAQDAVAALLTLSFVYGRGAGNWSAAARTALQSAAALLATYFVVSSPTTLTYTVTGEDSPSSSTLASAGSDLSAAGSGFFTTVVQEKILTGVDANGSAADGEIDWNFGNPWAFGATVDSAEYDFTSTAMHELLHTFGFLSYTEDAGSNTGRSWTVFDRYIVTDDGSRAISDSYRWNSALNTNLTGGGGGLYFGGPTAVAVYGGFVPLYTPDPWEPGSSVSHLDDATFTGAQTMMMNAVTDSGLGIRVLSPIELAILADLGYTVNGLDPAPLLAFLFLGFGLVRRRTSER